MFYKITASTWAKKERSVGEREKRAGKITKKTSGDASEDRRTKKVCKISILNFVSWMFF